MSEFVENRWIKRLGIGTLAVLGLGAVTLQSTRADAQLFVSFGVPAYAPAPYYAYPAYYGYTPYYGYPYYGDGVYFGFGGYHHWH